MEEPQNMNQKLFHPVIQLPANYEVYDFSKGYDPQRTLSSPFGVGKFLEKRPNMYVQEQFTKNNRNIHMGVDIGAPVGTPIYAFENGEIHSFTYNHLPGDYGYTLITKNLALGKILYCLHGHLSKQSVENKQAGQRFQKGDVIAWVGDTHENGGWNPHLHFQISVIEPKVCDMPGAVSEADLEHSLKIYMDPRLILGNIY